MSSNHTQGHFTAHTDCPNWYGFEARFFEVTAKDGVIVCFVKEWPDSVEESKANARLMAAAPELVDALSKMLYGDDPLAAREKAEAAIAKATGTWP